MTNDFHGCTPDGTVGLEPIPLFAKVVAANGGSAVKLSDNPGKATDQPIKVACDLRIFGCCHPP